MVTERLFSCSSERGGWSWSQSRTTLDYTICKTRSSCHAEEKMHIPYLFWYCCIYLMAFLYFLMGVSDLYKYLREHCFCCHQQYCVHEFDLPFPQHLQIFFDSPNPEIFCNKLLLNYFSNKLLLKTVGIPKVMGSNPTDVESFFDEVWIFNSSPSVPW